MENKTKELMRSVINEKDSFQKCLGLLELKNPSLNQYEETTDILDKIGTDFITNQPKFKTRKIIIEKKICLKLSRDGYYIFSGMHIPKTMNVSELLKIIGAKEIVGCDNCHKRPNELYTNSGELENEILYEVHTNDSNKTIELIRDYNHKH